MIYFSNDCGVSFKNFFRIPIYTPSASLWQQLLISLLCGVAVCAVLLLFRPFHLTLRSWWEFWVVIGYGGVTMISVLINQLFFDRLMPRFAGKVQRIGDQLLSIVWMTLFISVANFLYHNAINHFGDFSLRTLWMVVERTAMVAIVPFLSVYMLYLYQKVKTYEKIAGEFTLRPVQLATNTGNLWLKGEGKSDVLQISPEQILYLQSADNYVEVFWIENDQVKKYLLRGTLSMMEPQLEGQNLVRSHRSFIVNLSQVLTWEPSSNGLMLRLKHIEMLIPVSRKYLPAIRKVLGA